MGKKNKKKTTKPAVKTAATEIKVAIAEDNIEQINSEQVIKAEPISKKSEVVKTESPSKNEKSKKVKKEKKPNRLLRRLKETGSELKKVTWPTFPKVVKQTGVVLAVVVFFGLVLFGFDYLLKFLFELLVG